MKIILNTLLTVVVLVATTELKADNYTIKDVDKSITDDYDKYNEYLDTNFPLRAGEKNTRGEFYNDSSYFTTAQNRLIYKNCLLSNSTRWQINYIYGLNNAGKMYVELLNTDTGSRKDAVVTPSTNNIIDYCPVITWSMNDSCKKIYRTYGLTNDQNNGIFDLPVTSNANLTASYREYRNFEELYSETDSECVVNFTAKSPIGRAIRNTTFTFNNNVNISALNINRSTLLLAGKTNKNGKASIKFNLNKLFNKYSIKEHQGNYASSTLSINVPYTDKKWTGKSLSFSNTKN